MERKQRALTIHIFYIFFTCRSKMSHNAQMEDAAPSEDLQQTAIIEPTQPGSSLTDLDAYRS